MVQPQNLSTPKSIILTGPTAVGKSSLAIELALTLAKASADSQLEIINADSVCFYQEFNIGSAKPTEAELAQAPHHLINVAHPNDTYHVARFLADFEKSLADIHARGNRAIIVGGSGFYLKAMRLGLWDAPETSPEYRSTLENFTTPELYEKLLSQDEVHAKKIGATDRYRLIRGLEIIALSGKLPSTLEKEMNKTPDARFELWVLDRSKEELEERILKRVDQMLAGGWIEETKTLREKYPDSKTLHAVGYQQILDHLDGILPQGRMMKPGLIGLKEEIELAHRQLAKQQRTWFKGLNPEHTFTLETESKILREKLLQFYILP